MRLGSVTRRKYGTQKDGSARQKQSRVERKRETKRKGIKGKQERNVDKMEVVDEGMGVNSVCSDCHVENEGK